MAVVAVAVNSLVAARGGNAKEATPFLALSAVSVPEMPAKAAELVAAAAAEDRDSATDDVLRAAATMTKPGVMPYLVSAICHRCPASAGAAGAPAAALQPHAVLIFVNAPGCAAPSGVENIVYSACKKAPNHSANIALIASTELPNQKNEVLAGFANALPGLQTYLEKAKLQVGTNDSEAVIKQTAQLWEQAVRARSR